MRKYLDDIGVTERPDTWNKNDGRKKQWEEESKIYGFDERETWLLDFSFYLWLYERLKMFIDVCSIDLDYHKFKYNGEEYTQRQMIDMMLERLEFSFRKEYNNCDSEQYNYVSEIEKIWAIILPDMWW